MPSDTMQEHLERTQNCMVCKTWGHHQASADSSASIKKITGRRLSENLRTRESEGQGRTRESESKGRSRLVAGWLRHWQRFQIHSKWALGVNRWAMGNSAPSPSFHSSSEQQGSHWICVQCPVYNLPCTSQGDASDGVDISLKSYTAL